MEFYKVIILSLEKGKIGFRFLVDRKGHVVERYAPTTEPKKIVPDIENALNEGA